MDPVLEGITNLVDNCAEIQSGENVLVLSDHGEADPGLVALIADAVRDRGATCSTLWIDPVPAGAKDLPSVAVSAIKSADKVISQSSLSARGWNLEGALGGNPHVVVIDNQFVTPELMSSQHARYHWGMARAIYRRFEEDILKVGSQWRITTAAGTDISGSIYAVGMAGPGAEAQARAAAEEVGPTFIRRFQSGHFFRCGCSGTEGRIAVQYAGGRRRIPVAPSPFIVVEDNLYVRVEGDPGNPWVEKYTNLFQKRFEEKGEEFNTVHSYHGGLNPRAEPLPGDLGNACPGVLHFHAGPHCDHIESQVDGLTMEVDDQTWFDEGKLLIREDPVLKEAANRFGLDNWW